MYPKVHYRLRNSPTHISIQRQANPVYVIQFYFKIYYYCSFILLSSKWPFLWVFSPKPYMGFCLPYECYMPLPSHSLSFHHTSNLQCGEERTVVSCIVMRFYPACRSLLPLRRKYPITLFYKIPAPVIPCMREAKLRTHILTTCKIVFLYEYFSLSRSKSLRTASFVEEREVNLYGG